uniref:Uncharacterized protein n=1 Tax=Arundo donax TaxID=35708 RepID=A0A0A9G5P9_ARUDO
MIGRAPVIGRSSLHLFHFSPSCGDGGGLADSFFFLLPNVEILMRSEMYLLAMQK